MKCPKCGNEDCWRDSADVGVGIIFGPWGCPDCGWSEDSEYDLSEGQNRFDDKGGMIDQFGSYYPPGNLIALATKKAYEHGKESQETKGQENEASQAGLSNTRDRDITGEKGC